MGKNSSLVWLFFLLILIQTFANPVPFGSGMYGKKFQGDIMLTDIQKRFFLDGEKAESRSGLLDPVHRWPTNLEGYVIIPYQIEAHHGFSEYRERKQRIKSTKIYFSFKLNHNLILFTPR